MTIMGYLMFRSVQDLSLMFHMKNSAAKHSSSPVPAQDIRGARNGPSTPGESSSTSEHGHPPPSQNQDHWGWQRSQCPAVKMVHRARGWLLELFGWWPMAPAWAQGFCWRGTSPSLSAAQLMIHSELAQLEHLFIWYNLFISIFSHLLPPPFENRKEFFGGWGIMKDSYGRAEFVLVKTLKQRKKEGGCKGELIFPFLFLLSPKRAWDFKIVQHCSGT